MIFPIGFLANWSIKTAIEAGKHGSVIERTEIAAMFFCALGGLFCCAVCACVAHDTWCVERRLIRAEYARFHPADEVAMPMVDIAPSTIDVEQIVEPKTKRHGKPPLVAVAQFEDV